MKVSMANIPPLTRHLSSIIENYKIDSSARSLQIHKSSSEKLISSGKEDGLLSQRASAYNVARGASFHDGTHNRSTTWFQKQCLKGQMLENSLHSAKKKGQGTDSSNQAGVELIRSSVLSVQFKLSEKLDVSP